MSKTRETLVFGFALFAGFFGAGNLILPPLLGFKSGPIGCGLLWGLWLLLF